MTSIHKVILDHLETELRESLIDDIADEELRAGIVKQGDLQGEPDPDEARVSVNLYENDPDSSYGTGDVSAMSDKWVDEIQEIEIGGTTIWKRRFTVKARCLFVNTGETLEEAQEYARQVREWIENTLLNMSWVDQESTYGEFVCRGVVGEDIKSEMLQSGGPPDAFDYYIKVRFDVLTTNGVTA